MKKLQALILVSCFVVGIAMAQSSTTTTSVNVVGYHKISVQAGQFYLLAIQFDSMTVTNPTVNDVFGTNSVPDGLLVWVYNGQYQQERYYGSPDFAWDPGTNIIDRAAGFWIKSPVTTNIVLKGEVPVDTTPVVLSGGFQLVSFPYPVAVALTNTALGTHAQPGDYIYYYDGSYHKNTWYGDPDYTWDPYPDLVLNPGQCVWYKKTSGVTNLTETAPYDLTN